MSHTCFFEKNSRTFKSTTISRTFECATISRTAEVQAQYLGLVSCKDFVYPEPKFWIPSTITNSTKPKVCSNKAKRKHLLLLKEAHISFRERRLFFSETMTWQLFSYILLRWKVTISMMTKIFHHWQHSVQYQEYFIA